MPTLSSDDLRRRAAAMSQGALVLAVARYLHDHPDAPDAASAWLDGADRDLRDLATEDLASTATERLDLLDALRAEVDSHGGSLAEELRVDLAHARLHLQSARSGSFDTAVGPLRDFLADAGEAPQDLDIH